MNINPNVYIDLVGVVILGIILVTLGMNKGARSEGRRFLALVLLVLGIFMLDIPAWLLDGALFPGSRTLCVALDTAYYLCQIVYCYLWLLFAQEWIYDGVKLCKRDRVLLALPMALEIAVILLNINTGWVFTVDSANVYARGEYYLVNLIPYYFYIVGAVVAAVRACVSAKSERERQSGLAMLAFMLLPICGTVLETLYYGVSWLWPFSALSLLIVYVSAQQRRLAAQQVAAARLQKELSGSRMEIMLSQIKPHFLYNSLSTICALCASDAKTAERAAVEFTEFLRGNMDSLSAQKPISFEQELEHTRHYLALEKLRFEDRLTVTYDLRSPPFRIPTLTLQPIVENAVRCGVTRRKHGGAVTISTRETENANIITVADDGVGFDTSAPPSDDRSHVGIENVRQRLRSVCGGTLEISSEPGVGTRAVITIPKEKRDAHLAAGR